MLTIVKHRLCDRQTLRPEARWVEDGQRNDFGATFAFSSSLFSFSSQQRSSLQPVRLGQERKKEKKKEPMPGPLEPIVKLLLYLPHEKKRVKRSNKQVEEEVKRRRREYSSKLVSLPAWAWARFLMRLIASCFRSRGISQRKKWGHIHTMCLSLFLVILFLFFSFLFFSLFKNEKQTSIDSLVLLVQGIHGTATLIKTGTVHI